MIHSLAELAQGLKSLGYPVAYSHFSSAQTPPFICYRVIDSETLTGDNTVVDEAINVDIELYTETKNLTAENKIKQFLKDNELIWDYNEIFIESEGVFQCVFSIQLI
ncbi:hypothetical protein [Ureibacillus sp. FSL K6-0165]|uniref:hypothetical protein n=1 Tax=Ureibacillus sp. FSL K6-0165 TaxID=2954606 RepID=UPI0030FB9987